MTDSRICTDCKHYKSISQVGGLTGHRYEAERCAMLVLDPVHGGFYEPACEVSRLNDGMCGFFGKWWEAVVR